MNEIAKSILDLYIIRCMLVRYSVFFILRMFFPSYNSGFIKHSVRVSMPRLFRLVVLSVLMVL